MSSEHIELVQRAYEAMERGDVAALAEMCTDDVVFLPGRSALHGGYVGAAGFRTWFADNAETFEVYSATWDETYEAGDRVVALGQLTVRPRGGGPEATVSAAFVITFENGKIARAEDLRDRSAAHAFLGLPA